MSFQVIRRQEIIRRLIRQMAACAVCALFIAVQPARVCSQSGPVPGASGADPAGAPHAQPVVLKFLDSSTGQAVKPTAIHVNDTPADFTMEAGSLAVLELPEGKHTVQIEAENYQPLKSAVTVTAGSNPVMTFELDPTARQEAAPVAADVAVLEGHVTDADTGGLLERVQVSLPDARLTTTTDSSGSYQFEVKVPAASDAAQPAVTLEARAESYTPLRMKNLTLAPGQRRRMPLVLEKATSDTLSSEVQETDEASAADSHRSFDWVFDATIR